MFLLRFLCINVLIKNCIGMFGLCGTGSVVLKGYLSCSFLQKRQQVLPKGVNPSMVLLLEALSLLFLLSAL